MRVLWPLTFLAILAAGAAQAQTLRLHHPADANRDGVVSDAERADHEARKGDAAPWDEPSPYAVAPPPASGAGITFTPGTGASTTVGPARLEDRAVKASGFEEYINADADRQRRKD